MAIPPAGTSAYKAYFLNSSRGNFFNHLQSVMNGAGNVISPSVDGNIHPETGAKNLGIPSYVPHPETVTGLSSSSSAASAFKSPSKFAASPSRTAPSGSELSSQPQLTDYLDAPWASAYGMSKETAYSEAMENTSYRRSVVDMQKAGLNPAVIFGAGNGYTAGSPSYVSSAPSGSGLGSGSGSGSGRGRGRGRSNGKLFSSSAYSVMSALGGITGALATKSAGGYWLGVSLTQGAMNAMNLFSKR